MSLSIILVGMKRLELHLIGCSLLSVVLPIQTSYCGFVKIDVPKVVSGQLLDIGWVTVGHITLLPTAIPISTPITIIKESC